MVCMCIHCHKLHNYGECECECCGGNWAREKTSPEITLETPSYQEKATPLGCKSRAKNLEE